MFDNAPIFIGGSMKSGTTLLRRLIASHPNIFGGFETHWFSAEFLETWDQPESKRQVWLREFFEISIEEYNDIAIGSENAISFFNHFMEYCTARSHKNRWVEKTPGNISHIALIQSYWPKAKIINSVRDCRDVYASWKKISKKNIHFFIDYLKQINDSVGDILYSRTENYMPVIYEDLVDSPHTVLQEVFDFIQETYYEKIGAFTGDKSEYRKILETTGKASTTAISLSRPINNSSIGQYKAILTSEEIKVLETQFEDYLSGFGYIK